MRILASASVYFLNDTFTSRGVWSRRLSAGAALAIDQAGAPLFQISPTLTRQKMHLAKNFLRRMPSNTINSCRKSEEIVWRKAQSNGLED